MNSSSPVPPDIESVPAQGEKQATADVAQEPKPEAAEAPCPRCGGKLVNPQGLGWCPKCGYCRSLAEETPKALHGEISVGRPPSPLGAVEFFEMMQKLPRWLWVLLGGMGAVAFVSVSARLALPGITLARALCSSLLLLAGLISLLVAQAWALMRIAPEEDSLSAKDLILSAKLWTFAFRRLPETRKQVWLGTWSLTAGLCSVFVIGGFSYWWQFYHPKKVASKDLIGAIKDMGDDGRDDRSLTESVDDLAGKQDLTKKKDENDGKVDNRPTEQCVVIGYIVEEKELKGLVLALVDGKKLSFAGVVRKGFTEEDSKEILQQLAKAVRPDPLIKGLKLSAIWVKPEVFCEVHQSGRNKDGELINMNFAGLLTK